MHFWLPCWIFGRHLGFEARSEVAQERFLADRTATQYDRLLAAACCPSVRPSVCLFVCLSVCL